MADKKKKTDYEKTLTAAQRLMAYRPRSRKELEQRLRQKGFSKDLIGQVIAALESKKLIDDKRFAKLCVETRLHSKPSSLSDVKKYLEQKGVSGYVADDILSDYKDGFDEYEVAKSLAQKRILAYSGLKTIKAKKRLMDYLARRGFSYELVYKVLGDVFNEET